MSIEEMATVIEPRKLPNFVETPAIQELTRRAQAYIKAGFPLHFRGVSGTGKTTLAFHVASLLGRPVILIHGDEEFSTSDLVGGANGYRSRRMIDNFIHSVLKTEEDVQQQWIDSRLTVACRYGFTLIYDEFTRSRPEANNVFLSVLQEKLMDLPPARGDGESYLKVHPEFTAIFTSNPEEYAGVFRSQDALRDRMITLDLEPFDLDTEEGIVLAKSGLEAHEARVVVQIVRELRETGLCEFAPTVRGAIMIAGAASVMGCAISGADPDFKQICVDILSSESSRLGRKNPEIVEAIERLVDLQAYGIGPRNRRASVNREEHQPSA